MRELEQAIFLPGRLARLPEDVPEALKGLEPERVRIVETMSLEPDEFQQFAETLKRNRDWLKGKGGKASDLEAEFLNDPISDWDLEQRERWEQEAYRKVVLVEAPTRRSVVVDPQGCNYARCVGYLVFGLEPSTGPDVLCEREEVPLPPELLPENQDPIGAAPAQPVAQPEPKEIDEEMKPEYDFSEGVRGKHLTEPVPLMTAEMLKKGAYYPMGELCAHCDQPRGGAGVCNVCELTCGDPCDRCGSGKGEHKHCPCCTPCAQRVFLNEKAQQVLEEETPPEQPTAHKREGVDVTALLSVLGDDASTDDW